MTPDERRRTACWRLSVKGTFALRSLLQFLVEKQLGERWIDWCKRNPDIIKKNICYAKSEKLVEDQEVPDRDAMDITYLAHILRKLPLVNDEVKGHLDLVKDDIKAVTDIRNDLCHKFTEAMDESLFNQACRKLLNAFESIIEPAVDDRYERRQLMNQLDSFADPSNIDRYTNATVATSW